MSHVIYWTHQQVHIHVMSILMYGPGFCHHRQADSLHLQVQPMCFIYIGRDIVGAIFVHQTAHDKGPMSCTPQFMGQESTVFTRLKDHMFLFLEKL